MPKHFTWEDFVKEDKIKSRESKNKVTNKYNSFTNDSFKKCSYEVIENKDKHNNKTHPRKSIAFDSFSLTGFSHILEQEQTESTFILDQLARLGEYTVISGPPNVSKTLTTLAFVTESIQAGRIKAEDVYYLDLDDSHKALLEKLTIFEELGINILADGYQNFNASRFSQYLDEISKNNKAHGKIIILDTLKKFVDVMNKRQASEWGKTIRRFTAKGGSIIALAHVNKHSDKNGKHIMAGVSDIGDDCDTAYTMRKVHTDIDKNISTVEFENIKRRGDVAGNIAFTFSIDPKISYEERLASVERIDQDYLEKIKTSEALNTDSDLINITINCIKDGTNTKMRLRDEINKRSGISKRSAVKLLEKYQGTDHTKHKWSFTVQERGKKVYTILRGDKNEQ